MRLICPSLSSAASGFCFAPLLVLMALCSASITDSHSSHYGACPNNSKAVGFAFKLWNDSSLNAISFRCSNYGATIITPQGRGNWSQYRNCASNAFIVSYQLRLGLHPSGESLVNDMNVMCSNDSYIYGKGINQGNWTSWEIFCPRGACGFSARVNSQQSMDDDSDPASLETFREAQSNMKYFFERGLSLPYRVLEKTGAPFPSNLVFALLFNCRLH